MDDQDRELIRENNVKPLNSILTYCLVRFLLEGQLKLVW